MVPLNACKYLENNQLARLLAENHQSLKFYTRVLKKRSKIFKGKNSRYFAENEVEVFQKCNTRRKIEILTDIHCFLMSTLE